MKSLKRITAFISVLTLVSCTDTFNEETSEFSPVEMIELTAEEYASISNDDVYELSDEEIYEVINEFEILGQGAKTRNIGPSNIKIRERSTLFNGVQKDINTRSFSNDVNSTTIAMVEITYDQSSDLVIVGTDSRSPKVIAYIGNGTDEIYPEELHFLLSIAKEKQLYDISLTEDNKNKLRESTVRKICEDLDISPNDYSFNNIRDRIIIHYASGKTRAVQSNGIVGMPPRVKSWIGPLGNFDWSTRRFNQFINGGKNYYYWVETSGSKRTKNSGHVPISHSIMTLSKAVAIAESWVHPVDKNNKLMPGIFWPWIKETPGPVWDHEGDEIMGWGEKWPVMNGYMNLLYRHSRSYLKVDSEGIVERMITPNDGMRAIAQELISFQTLPYYDWNVAKASLDNIRPVILYGTMKKSKKLVNGIDEMFDCAILIDGYAICDAGVGTIGSTIKYLHTNTVFDELSLSNVWFIVPDNMVVEMEWENNGGIYTLNTSQMSMMYQIYNNGWSYWDTRLWDYYGPQPPDPRDPPGPLDPGW